MPFFLSHVQSMDAVLKKLKHFRPHQYDLAVIGSLLPDLEYTGVLPDAHSRCLEFYEHMLVTDMAYVPLALGMVSHVIYDSIIEPGYVHIKEPEAITILEKFYPSSAKIKWAAHTFIEQAIDTHVLMENPQLPKLLMRANKHINEQQLDKIAHYLSVFFGADRDRLFDALTTFRQFNLGKIRSHHGISKLWLKCMFMLSNEHILKEHAGNPIAKLKAVIQLGWSYSKFRMSHRLWHMFSHARGRFNDHKSIRKKAINVLHLELKKLIARQP